MKKPEDAKQAPGPKELKPDPQATDSKSKDASNKNSQLQAPPVKANLNE